MGVFHRNITIFLLYIFIYSFVYSFILFQFLCILFSGWEMVSGGVVLYLLTPFIFFFGPFIYLLNFIFFSKN